MEGGKTSKISFKFCTLLTPEKPTLVGLGKGRYRKPHFISSVLHEGTWFVLVFFFKDIKVAGWQKRCRFVWRQAREKALQKWVQSSFEGMEQWIQIVKSWQPVGRGSAPCMTAAKMEKMFTEEKNMSLWIVLIFLEDNIYNEVWQRACHKEKLLLSSH